MLDKSKVKQKRDFPVQPKQEEKEDAESEEGVIPSQIDELIAKLSLNDE